MQGKLEGIRLPGRSLMRWTDQVKTTVGGPLHVCTRDQPTKREILSLMNNIHDDHDHSVKSDRTTKKNIDDICTVICLHL